MTMLLFVYGTLKRGYSNHAWLAGQRFVGTARTVPGYRLHDLGGYPGIVRVPDETGQVSGEVWEVQPDALRKLDHFEGVHEGLYRREPLPLAPPFDRASVDAYVSVLSVLHHPLVGSEWIEPRS